MDRQALIEIHGHLKTPRQGKAGVYPVVLGYLVLGFTSPNLLVLIPTSPNLNKAVYTTASVACGWAGAVT